MTISKTNKKVEIYSTPLCAYCNLAKEYFHKNNIQFTEYNVASDAKKRMEMLEMTHQFGVPVIVIDGKVILGFDKPRISEMLGI